MVQVYNGNQWYVDQTMGPGSAIENFYTNPSTKAAYKTWVRRRALLSVFVNGPGVQDMLYLPSEAVSTLRTLQYHQSNKLRSLSNLHCLP